jgi:hypothetical protein
MGTRDVRLNPPAVFDGVTASRRFCVSALHSSEVGEEGPSNCSTFGGRTLDCSVKHVKELSGMAPLAETPTRKRSLAASTSPTHWSPYSNVSRFTSMPHVRRRNEAVICGDECSSRFASAFVVLSSTWRS